MVFGYNKQAIGTLAGISRQGSARVCSERHIVLFDLFLRDWLVVLSRPVRLFLGFKMKAQKQAAVLLLITLALLQVNTALAVPPGTVLSNTANAGYSIGGVPGFTSGSNTVDITTTLNLTPSNISFFQYSPSGAGANMLASPSFCANGAATGPFIPQGNPTYPGLGIIDVTVPVNLLAATRFNQGEPIFIRTNDANANINPGARDTLRVTVTVTETGDAEVIEMTETANNSGIFVGYIPSSGVAMAQYDCQLSVQEDNNLTVTYTDVYDVSDTANAQALVDPFGRIFDSATGNFIDGATITIIDSGTGLPATVFGDDGVSTYPATITSGGSATDSGGTVYNFPPGGYRYPLMTPGTYRMTIVPPTGYSAPSAVTIPVLQTLPGAPFALDINASFGLDFILNAGPPVNVDIPADPSGASTGNLFLSKKASKNSAAVGEFIRYTLTLDNTDLLVASSNTVITDVLPLGFRYQESSAHLNGNVMAGPSISADGRTLKFNIGTLAADSRATVTYVTSVIANAEKGKAVNTAQATNVTASLSNLAISTVTIKEDLFTSRSHVFGRVTLGNCKIDTPGTGFVDMRLRSKLFSGRVRYELTITGTTVPVKNMRVTASLPPELSYIDNSARLEDGMKLAPIQKNNTLEFYVGDRGKNWSRTIIFDAQTQSDNAGTSTTVVYAKFDSPSEKDLMLKASNSLTHRLFKPEDKTIIALPNFDKSRIQLNLADRTELDSLVKRLQGKIIKRVKISGHSDSMVLSNTAQDEYLDNYSLSLERAKSVGAYLDKYLKIDKNNISLRGYGPDLPVAGNDTEVGRRANRRVEVEITTLQHKPRLKWEMLTNDSELQRARIEDALQKKGELTMGEDLPGVKGVRLVTENGIYVTTDDQGMYHIEGLKPGTHVLQIDTATLPSNLEAVLCEENTRFAGSGYSQFIDLQGGTLWRADFYLREKAPLQDNVNLRMRTQLNELDADITIDLEGNRFIYDKLRLLVMLPNELEYIPGSSRHNNMALGDPEIQDGVLAYRLAGTGKEAWKRSLTLKVKAVGVRKGEIKTKAILMFETLDGKRHKTPVATNSLVHSVPEDRKQQFTFRPKFTSARAKLRVSDKKLLNKIIGQFKDIQINAIKVIGHADNQPLSGAAKKRFKDNMTLSGVRATSVADYIGKILKLDKSQIEVVAMGATKPLVSNDTAEGRAINRRVELFVDAVQKSKEGAWNPAGPKNKIYYVKSKYKIDNGNREEIQVIINNLKKQKPGRIRVVGHSDSKGLIKTPGKDNFDTNYALSRARAETVAETLRTELKLKPEQVVVDMRGASQPVASNRTESGRDLNRRVEIFVEAEEQEHTLSAKPDWKPVQSDSGLQSVKVKVKRTVGKFSLPQLPETKKIKLSDFDAKWLAKEKPGFEWILPLANSNPNIPSIKVGVKYDPAYQLTLTLNGRPVSGLNLDSVLKRKDGKVAVNLWAGVNIFKGDNELEAILTDKSGKVVRQIKNKVHYSGPASKVEYVEKYSSLAANGRDTVVIAVRLRDSEGYPVRAGTVGEFILLPPYELKTKLDDLRVNVLTGKRKRNNIYKVLSDGIALIQVEPTTDANQVQLRFRFNDRYVQKMGVWLQAEQRDWVLAGLAEGTAAYKTIEGNMEALKALDEKDGLNTDGRLAFYAKGSIKGNWLLTAAFDSKKEERPADAVLHGLIDPNKYYTLYGDKTERRVDAPSRKKLYIKLERRQFYALFGDYNTGLTVTELSRYNRSLTGLKSEFGNKNFDLNVFAAETEQAFIKDEIQGDGTSGLYKLSQQNIVFSSEKITIETRDRFQSQVVLTSRVLTRFIDYTLDPVSGTLYFREPIYSQDANFNPIYIVADYEIESNGDKTITAGGRGAVKFLDERIEVGATAITEGTKGNEGELVGADVRIEITPGTQVKAEIATSKKESGTTSRKGDAWLAEVTHRTKKVDGKVFIREQQAGFGLGQQMGSETGTRKTGLDVNYRHNDKVTVHGEARRDENLATKGVRDVAAADLTFREKAYSLSGGFRKAKDTNALGEKFSSNLMTLGASHTFFGSKLNLRANSELALDKNNNANPDYPSKLILGGDYQILESTRIFAQEEFTFGKYQDTQATRVGVETRPFERTRIRTDMTNEVSEYGPRTYAGLGLNQGFKLSEQWMLDFGFDQRKTVRDPGNTQFNVNVPPASGTVNNDFYAVSVGATYRQKLWSATGRMEYRDAEQDKKSNLLFGFYRDYSPGIGFATKINIFKAEQVLVGDESINAEAEFSLAYRPIRSRWAVLDKLRLFYSGLTNINGSSETEKIVNNMNTNWLINRQNQLALHWGIKQVIDSYVEGDYKGITQAVGAEYRYDLTSNWDLGLRIGALYTDNYRQHTETWGVSAGYNVARNMWLTVGYNFDGFEDRDFSGAGYSTKGTYVKFRFSFDQLTARSVMAFWEKDENIKPKTQ